MLCIDLMQKKTHNKPLQEKKQKKPTNQKKTN